MIIAFVVISIMDSKKKSDAAKQQRTQRQQTTGQQVYRSGDEAKQMNRPQPSKQPKKQEGSFMESLTDFLESLEDALEVDPKQAKQQKPVQGNKQVPTSKQKVDTGKTLMQSANKKKKTAPQNAKKSPAQLPTKTLMEQRPDREQREEHTKVSASVKPLKNAFENDENCEHRIQLNPNIQYSKQQQTTANQRAAIVKTDGESIVQGIIWSEILGPSKAKINQNRTRRMDR